MVNKISRVEMTLVRQLLVLLTIFAGGCGRRAEVVRNWGWTKPPAEEEFPRRGNADASFEIGEPTWGSLLRSPCPVLSESIGAAEEDDDEGSDQKDPDHFFVDAIGLDGGKIAVRTAANRIRVLQISGIELDERFSWPETPNRFPVLRMVRRSLSKGATASVLVYETAFADGDSLSSQLTFRSLNTSRSSLALFRSLSLRVPGYLLSRVWQTSSKNEVLFFTGSASGGSEEKGVTLIRLAFAEDRDVQGWQVRVLEMRQITGIGEVATVEEVEAAGDVVYFRAQMTDGRSKVFALDESGERPLLLFDGYGSRLSLHKNWLNLSVSFSAPGSFASVIWKIRESGTYQMQLGGETLEWKLLSPSEMTWMEGDALAIFELRDPPGDEVEGNEGSPSTELGVLQTFAWNPDSGRLESGSKPPICGSQLLVQLLHRQESDSSLYGLNIAGRLVKIR